MTREPAANDSAADIAAGLALLVRFQRSRLRAVRRYVFQTLALQGAIIVVCVTVAAGALAVAGARDEPLRSIMRACAVLNGLTLALCLRSAFHAIRDALAEARHVRGLLRETEAASAALETARQGAPEKTLPAVSNALR